MRNQSTHTEEELISLCKNRDRKAQKALFETHAPVMLTVCKRYVGDHSTAEEIMLIGFMKVFEKLDQFKAEGSFQGWVRRVMVTTCLGWIRKNKSVYKEVDVEEVEYQLGSEPASSALESEDLMKLVDALPQGYKTVFNLYAIEGYNHAEIGTMLGISENTSKSQLSRARKLLQAGVKRNDEVLNIKGQSYGG
ncbi:MAG: sigma-70 family RNA polymerase sigma factor [Reichenbachiella sp.]